MAYGYFRSHVRDHEAVFHLYFREAPFGGSYAIACGLPSVVDALTGYRFEEDEVRYLAGLRGVDGRPLFDAEFLDGLRTLRFSADVDAVPEGTVVFPNEPLLRVEGKLIQCQLVETLLLTLVNFPTLVATKASRVARAAGGSPVLEFGLRRAQGPDGGLTASRAAWVGGCAATSNLEAGARFDIPVKGTHAHSWVLAFDSEQEAFDAWADVQPGNCILLVDTFDTLEGVRRAARVGRRMKARGAELHGVRLDSGDLLALSLEARAILDAAGLESTRIVASGDLDENAILRLKDARAPIDVWGVGTRLSTAWDQPALGGVYKLGAIRAPGGEWQSRAKSSDEPGKATPPGILGVRRCDEWARFTGDWIHDVRRPLPRDVPPGHELLVPVLRGGEPVGPVPTTAAARARARDQLARFDDAVLRLRNPAPYPVRWEPRLARLLARRQP